MRRHRLGEALSRQRNDRRAGKRVEAGGKGGYSFPSNPHAYSRHSLDPTLHLYFHHAQSRIRLVSPATGKSKTSTTDAGIRPRAVVREPARRAAALQRPDSFATPGGQRGVCVSTRLTVPDTSSVICWTALSRRRRHSRQGPRRTSSGGESERLRIQPRIFECKSRTPVDEARRRERRSDIQRKLSTSSERIHWPGADCSRGRHFHLRLFQTAAHGDGGPGDKSLRRPPAQEYLEAVARFISVVKDEDITTQ